MIPEWALYLLWVFIWIDTMTREATYSYSGKPPTSIWFKIFAHLRKCLLWENRENIDTHTLNIILYVENICDNLPVKYKDEYFFFNSILKVTLFDNFNSFFSSKIDSKWMFGKITDDFDTFWEFSWVGQDPVKSSKSSYSLS